jgi:6-phosphofructokinase 1
MRGNMHRIAINFGTGYVAGLNAVVTGAMLAARQLGWTVVGIRDGFDGLMFPDRYPGGGLVELHASMTENMDQDLGAVLGTASRTDPECTGTSVTHRTGDIRYKSLAELRA